MRPLKKINILIISIIINFYTIKVYAQVPTTKTVSESLEVTAEAHSSSNKKNVNKKKKKEDSYEKYVTVDKSGDMSLRIPLYMVKGRRLELPINANYKSGIKVDQKSSEIGLGWDLNFGSIERDYGSFEPDYTTHGEKETIMDNIEGFPDGTLSHNGNAYSTNFVANPYSNGGKQLKYTGLTQNQTTADDYHLNIPGLGTKTFWFEQDVKFNDLSNWLVSVDEKTFTFKQEFSRINEANLPLGGLIQSQYPCCKNLTSHVSYASAICILPYVTDRSFSRYVVDFGMTGIDFDPYSNPSNPSNARNTIRYRDYEKFYITTDNGTQYIFGKPLREQKYLFPDDPFWSTISKTDRWQNFSNTTLGEWWKTDYIKEWLLTEIRSNDYVNVNSNGIADGEDGGDWIRIEYTTVVQNNPFIGPMGVVDPNQNTNSNYREWLNYTQTDVPSSIFRERAYVTHIYTPLEVLDFTVSDKNEIDRDYFELPANYLENWSADENFVYNNIANYNNLEAMHIHYPNEVKKYDKIIIKNAESGNIKNTIKFNYAETGSTEELCVSNYTIRDNNDEEDLTPYVNTLTQPGFFNDPSNSNYYETYYHRSNGEGRGKTTLLGIDICPGVNITSEDKTSYKFEYNFNPSFDEIHKKEIVKKRYFPTVRQSFTQDPRWIPTFPDYNYNNMPPNDYSGGWDYLSISNYSTIYQSSGFDLNTNVNVVATFANSNSIPPTATELVAFDNSGHVYKDECGFYFDENSTCPRAAWSMTKLIIPEGGNIEFQYENDESDVTNDRSHWWLMDNGIPTISYYNEVAREKGVRQDIINWFYKLATFDFDHIPPKNLTMQFRTPGLLSSSGGLRLKDVKINDNTNNLISPQQTIAFQYGTGHFLSVPGSYWNNYISSYSEFLLEERSRHHREVNRYAPYFYNSNFIWVNDFENSLGVFPISIRLDNSVNDEHYYEYVEEVYGNGSKLKKSYGNANVNGSAIPYKTQKFVIIKGVNQEPNFRKVGSIIQQRDLFNDVDLLQISEFRAGETNSFKTQNFSYTLGEEFSIDLSVQAQNQLIPWSTYNPVPPGYITTNGQDIYYYFQGATQSYTAPDLDLPAATISNFKQGVWKYLSQQNVVMDGVTQTSQFFYDNSVHKQLTRVKDFLSDGRELTTTMTYPKSYNSFFNDPASSAIHTLKIKNINLVLEKYQSIYDPSDNSDKLIGGSVTKFKEFQTGQVYPEFNYSLEINSPLNINSFDPSISNSTTAFTIDSHYKLQNSNLVYDKFGQLTQSQINNWNVSSLQYDAKSLKLLATFDNAKYVKQLIGNECSFTGFEGNQTSNGNQIEEDFWGFDLINTPYFLDPHTGKNSLKILAASNGPVYGPTKDFFPDNQFQKYRLSCWVKTEPNFETNKGSLIIYSKHNDDVDNSLYPNVNGAWNSTSFSNTNGNWQYVESIIDMEPLKQAASNDPLRLRCFTLNEDENHFFLLDDIRLQPIPSNLISYTYDDVFMMPSSKSDINSNATYYEYNEMGELHWTEDLNHNLIAHNEHHYKNNIYPNNVIVSDILQKQNILRSDIESQTYNLGDLSRTYQYLNELGDPLQTIGRALSPTNNDMVQTYKYDNCGREIIKYPLYTDINSSDGSLKTDPFTDLENFYQNSDAIEHTTNAKAEIQYENGPETDRITAQGAFGDYWQFNLNGHQNHFAYSSNTSSDNILNWRIFPNYDGADVLSGFDENELYKNILEDENGSTVQIFFDKQGRKICKREIVRSDISDSEHPVTYDYTDGFVTDNSNYTSNLDNINNDTYYLYDDFGRLNYIIPPQASNLLAGSNAFDESSTTFKDFIYAYHYDEKDRLIEQKIPGKDREFIIYDKRDQVVLSQDGNLRSDDKWFFFKYDVLGRTALNGIFNFQPQTTDPQIELQSILNLENNYYERRRNETSDVFGYTNSSYPQLQNQLLSDEVLSINYFDTYDYPSNSIQYQTYGSNIKCDRTNGLTTCSIVKVLGTGNPGQYLTTVNYFDEKNRPIQQYKQHFGDGADLLNNIYDFHGNILESQRDHSAFTNSNNPTTIRIKSEYSYDDIGRLIDIFKYIDNDEQNHLVFNQYNDLGQLVRKSLHWQWPESENNGFLQDIDYRYNSRGWLKKINNSSLIYDSDNPSDNDVFGEELYYGDIDLNCTGCSQGGFGFTSIPQYNGNISGLRWKTKASAADGIFAIEHAYNFRYDNLDRLTGAYYAENTIADPTNFNASVNRYLEVQKYDAMGNILNLKRNARKGRVDDLTYTYINQGNQLKSVEDAAPNSILFDFKNGSSNSQEYFYDNNGNLTQDDNKELTSFQYNFLNLPTEIIKNINESIQYVYDANGTKLSKTFNGITRYYLDGIEYEGNTLDFIETEEGKARLKSPNAQNDNQYVFDYFIKDHLGDVRAVVTNEKAFIINEASMEERNDSIETKQFYNITSTRANKPLNYPADSTNTPNEKVSKLNSATNKTIGHAKVLEMLQGDVVDVDTKYFYESSGAPSHNTSPVTDILGQLLTIFTEQALPGMNGEQTEDFVENSFSNVNLINFLTTALDTTDSSGFPLAFLTWLYFDKELNFLESASGTLRADQQDQLKHLTQLNIEAPENGYLYVYVSNESSKDVSFDDLKVKYTQNSLREVDHYYPFGLINEFLSSKFIDPVNKYKYNGKEWENEMGLNFYDYGARMQDPELARWHNVDPQADLYELCSSYAYGLNRPNSLRDPDGKGVLDVIKGFVASTLDNSSLGFIDLRSAFAPSNPADYDDFNRGLDNGDAFTIAAALTETAGGEGMTGAGMVLAPSTEGTSMVLAVPGQAAVIHGTAVAGLALYNFASKKGRVSEKKEKEPPTFNRKSDSEVETQRESFRKTKDLNGIPRSQQPIKTENVTENGTGKKVRQFTFKNSYNEDVVIRRDNAREYKNGPPQGPHHNAGSSPTRTSQHHNYKAKAKPKRVVSIKSHGKRPGKHKIR